MALGLTPQEIVDRNQYPLLSKAESWKRIQLAKVAFVQNGYAFKSSFFDRDEGVPLIRIRDITKSSTEHKYKGEYDPEYVVKNGDILIGMDGDFIVSRWKGQDALLNQRVCRIKLINENFDEKFLFICLQPYLDAIHAETSSVTVKHLSSRTISQIPLPFPSIQEQKDIVAKIETLFSELDKGIESLKTARQQLKAYRQAILKHAFEGKLTEQWRQQNPEKLEPPEQLLTRIQQKREQRYQQLLEEWKQAVKVWEDNGKERKKPGKPKTLREMSVLDGEVLSSLPEAPPSWMWGKLGLMTCGVEYGTSAKSSGVGDVPVVRMGNLQSGIIDWSDLVFTSDKEEIEKYSLQAGDVLFNRTNSPELVGKSAIYKGEREALFAGYLIRVNHIPNIVDGRYLNYFLSSSIAKGYGNTVKTDGVNQSNINGEKLQGYPFPFCSLEEQREVVTALDEKLSTAEKTLEEIGVQLDKAETFRQSILKRAFSGQLIEEQGKIK